MKKQRTKRFSKLPKYSKPFHSIGFNRDNVLFYYHDKDSKIVVYKLGIDIDVDLFTRRYGQVYSFIMINESELLESIDDIYRNKWIRSKCMKRSYRKFILNNINELRKVFRDEKS